MIGEGGIVDGEVRGRDVIVLGRVRGDLHASGHLEIGPNGKVLGDVTVQSFRMHKGGVFRGMSSMPSDETTLALPTGAPEPKALSGLRGRTLPPPTGTGAVPPPPTLAELAAGGDEAVSQERLVTSDAGEAKTAVG